MIEAENLTKKFENFTAVDGIRLYVPSGQVLALLGPNGAGKTTTVRMLTSILRPTHGWARVAGFDVVKQAEQVRASVGVLTENHGLYVRMNAEEYLQFFAELYGIDPGLARTRYEQMMDKFGLAWARHKRLGEFSKGMRQKLALIRALLHDPPVLLLDEPTSAMDPESARTVRDVIQSLRTSVRTIVLCTHNLTEAEELADQIAIIRNGRIIFNDTPANLKMQLLGPVEFEAHLASSLNGWLPNMPAGTDLVEKTDQMIRFRVERPEISNPVLIRQLLEHEMEIISFQEVSRSLERAYLQAVSQNQ